MTTLTHEENLTMEWLASGPIEDRDCIPERVLVNLGYAKRVDTGMLEITATGHSYIDKFSREKPSRHGKMLGDALALLAAAGRKDAPMPIPECCLTCAFRPGAMPNEMAGTEKSALDCTLGIDRDRFACHHGMKAGQPSRLCFGYVAAILAPWSFTKEVMNALKDDLDSMGDGPDEVRAAFDVWLAKTDPQGTMDQYQLARAYAVRDR
jgi:hypothetical protein